MPANVAGIFFVDYVLRATTMRVPVLRLIVVLMFGMTIGTENQICQNPAGKGILILCPQLISSVVDDEALI